MKRDAEVTEAGSSYATAYNAHYTGRDFPLAMQLYTKLMAAHPTAAEADYSRMQIQNIANVVVPKQELLDAQVGLVLSHLERTGNVA